MPNASAKTDVGGGRGGGTEGVVRVESVGGRAKTAGQGSWVRKHAIWQEALGLSSRKPPAPGTVAKSTQNCRFRYPILWNPWSRYRRRRLPESAWLGAESARLGARGRRNARERRRAHGTARAAGEGARRRWAHLRTRWLVRQAPPILC